MMRLLSALFVLSMLSCTDADVYSATGGTPLTPDRIAITGRVCTEDTTGSTFPIKGLVMFDATATMFSADPGNYRLCGSGTCSPGSITALIDRMHNQQNAWLGFARIGGISVGVSPVPPASCAPDPCEPQQYYPANEVDSGVVAAGFSTVQGGQREVGNAISLAQSFITANMAKAKAGEILRTRYIVYMLFAGPPQGLPVPEASELAEQVKNLRTFAYSKGVLEFRLNVGLLSGELDAAERQAAIDAYSSMAFEGEGVFREFVSPPNIDVQLDAASTTIRLMRKDIVAYNLNERLGSTGPVVDSDGDGLSDAEEAAAFPPTNPYLWDTDGDGLSDRLEFRAYPRQNPVDKRDRPAACLDPDYYDIRDSDLDLLNDCEEGLLQTSATIPDSDGDGLPDALEFMSGTVPTSADDRLLDYDGDGISNAQEVLEHTNPRANEGQRRGAERYSHEIIDLGRREVAYMEDQAALRAVSFRSAGPGVKGGAAFLKWNAGTRTLEWSDARWQSPGGLAYVPIPVAIDQSGIYTLCAENRGTGEQVCIEVNVVVEWLPVADTEIYPLISIAERNCYDVRFSNIKLVQTAPAVDVLHPNRNGSGNPVYHEEGTNHILVFFTQAPETRLDAPGIARIAEISVRFMCGDSEKPETCARNPEGGFVTLDDSQFAASVQ